MTNRVLQRHQMSNRVCQHMDSTHRGTDMSTYHSTHISSPDCSHSKGHSNGPSYSAATQTGFTLIELMIIVSIIAILAAIAIPSYRIYVVRNAESDVQRKMLMLSNELEQWRSKALTYKGFKPKDDEIADSTGAILHPSSNAQYTITLGHLQGTPPSTFSTLHEGGGRANNWVMLATPIDMAAADYFLLTSQGVRCANTVAIDITDSDCGAGATSW